MRRRLPKIPIALTLFFLTVVLPLTASIFYFGFIIADRYVSETKFIVRSLSTKHISGLDAVLRSFGLASAQDDAYAITSFVQSRDAIHEIEGVLPLREMFNRKEADLFSSFKNPMNDTSFESLYKYSQSIIQIARDSNTGVITLTVAAFRPEDSQAIANALLGLAEKLVNRMNERAQHDAISGAEKEVAEAQAAVLAAQADLTNFRNKELLIDPNEASTKVIELVGALSAQLAVNMAEIRESSITSPSNPGIGALQSRSTALQEQIALERSKLAGNDKALAAKISTYEQLVMNREFVERKLSSSMISLESARQDARRQQVYIEAFVEPNKADKSLQPRRLHDILTVGFVCLIGFGLTWVLFAGVKEHVNG